MPGILAIESSTTNCSVALCNESGDIIIRETDEGYNHASLLTCYIDEVIKEAGYRPEQLGAVVVSKGPGSYTGLRIGVSAAKGVCFAANIPLIGISAIEAIAWKLAPYYSPDDFIVPMIDAGRKEVYTAVFKVSHEIIEPVSAKIIDINSFDHLPGNSIKVLAGNGSGKFTELFAGNESIVIRSDVLPSAKLLCAPGMAAFKAGKFEDVAYFAPMYIKDFIAGKPRVKGLFK